MKKKKKKTGLAWLARLAAPSYTIKEDEIGVRVVGTAVSLLPSGTYKTHDRVFPVRLQADVCPSLSDDPNDARLMVQYALNPQGLLGLYARHPELLPAGEEGVPIHMGATGAMLLIRELGKLSGEKLSSVRIGSEIFRPYDKMDASAQQAFRARMNLALKREFDEAEPGLVVLVNCAIRALP